eukprot:gene14108-21621_t
MAQPTTDVLPELLQQVGEVLQPVNLAVDVDALTESISALFGAAVSARILQIEREVLRTMEAMRSEIDAAIADMRADARFALERDVEDRDIFPGTQPQAGGPGPRGHTVPAGKWP